MGSVWTMDELVERVARALAAEYAGAPNGRVRDLPDRRAIRWYTTTGLVDRPAGMRGRTALYGRRHLLQLVAVKRRQAQGHTLAAIQAELHGASEAVLADVARVPEEVLTGGDPAAAPDAGPARARFWAEPPAPRPPTNAAQAPADETARAEDTAPAGDIVERPVGALRLPGGVVLVVPGVLDAGDRAAIAAAAGPLLAVLADRGLLMFDDGNPS
jgi:DNA-binding transcriptional MerR regulator